MKNVYIAGPLFDDHEREYLEKIAAIFEKRNFSVFLPHRDAGLVEGEFTVEKKKQVFDIDMEALSNADIVVALLTGRDIDSGTAAAVPESISRPVNSATTISALDNASISISKTCFFFSTVNSPSTRPASL